MTKIPRIGVVVLIFKGSKVLFGKRFSEIGRGTWALPGGHLEYGEILVDCVKREVEEETSLSN